MAEYISGDSLFQERNPLKYEIAYPLYWAGTHVCIDHVQIYQDTIDALSIVSCSLCEP